MPRRNCRPSEPVGGTVGRSDAGRLRLLPVGRSPRRDRRRHGGEPSPARTRDRCHGAQERHRARRRIGAGANPSANRERHGGRLRCVWRVTVGRLSERRGDCPNRITANGCGRLSAGRDRFRTCRRRKIATGTARQIGTPRTRQNKHAVFICGLRADRNATAGRFKPRFKAR